METVTRQTDFSFGPFVDYEENPILKPPEGSPLKRIYNPTVLKEGDKFYMLYRAETDDGLTGSIGLAESGDGYHFTCHEEPVLTPDDDFDRGGCEDPRIMKIGETYYLTYVGNSHRYNVSNICIATSKDLSHWTKHGQVLSARAGSWNGGQLKAGAIVPEKIGTRYVMYFMGEEKPWTTATGIACSDDLFNWYEPVEKPVLVPRPECFDSQGIEPGPTPVVLDEGILLIYNGWGRDCIYKPTAALFSKDYPSEVIWRADKPLLEMSRDYGKEFGEGNQCVAEGLVKAGDRWLMYYGAADRFVCLAIYEESTR
jgi:predicted GH43/DUF377 family glycosyl hydrolase